MTVLNFPHIYNKKHIMSRKKLNENEKKVTVSVRIPNELLPHLDDIKNKSKFFEWLLEEYFNLLKDGK